MSKTHSRHRSGARPDRSRGTHTKAEAPEPKSASARRLAAARADAMPPGGEFYGRRVGRTSADLGDLLRPIDSEERRAGMPSTARRNAKKNISKTTHALEDSATGKPSRKSTRRAGPTHVKADSQKRRQTTRAMTSPKARATRAAATTKRSSRTPAT